MKPVREVLAGFPLMMRLALAREFSVGELAARASFAERERGRQWVRRHRARRLER